MLEFIRERAQGWIAMLIVGMLIIVMAIWGLDWYFSPDPNVTVAKVNGEKITTDQFRRQYQLQRAQLQQMVGGQDISRLIPDEAKFKRDVLQQMVQEEVLVQATSEAGYRISDAFLAQQIRDYDAFKSDGKFDSARYEELLKQQQMTPAQFEHDLRRGMLAQQFRQGILATAMVPVRERDALLSGLMQTRNIGYVLIPAARYEAAVTIDDAGVQQYYEKNAKRFAIPEQVSVDYLELNAADLAQSVAVDETALRNFYTEQVAEYGVPEERRTRHILIEVPAKAPEADVARAKAEELLKRIRGGESFEAVARQASDDIGSAKSGGDLGFLTRSAMMDKAYADAAFALTQGQVSEPVRSSFGFHLIQLAGIKPAQTKPFEQMRAQLEHDFRQRKAEEKFYELAETLGNLTFENPDNLTSAAEQLKLAIKSTPLFSRDQGEGIAADAKVRAAAFGDEVLVQRRNSEPVELGPSHIVVVRVKEHREATTRPLAEVRDEVVRQLRLEGARAKAMEIGKALLAKLNQGGELQTLLKEQNLAWQQVGWVARSGSSVEGKIVAQAFRLPRPEAGKVSYGAAGTMSGDFAVVGVYGVQDGDPAGVDASQKQALVERRGQTLGRAELEGAVQRLQSAAKVKEYPENL